MPVTENPGFGTALAGGFFNTAIPSLQKALAQYLEEARQRKAFNDFMAQTTTTKTVPAPTSPAIPPPLGSLLQNAPVRGVETQTQEQLPVTDPKYQQALAQYGIADPTGMSRYVGIQQATQPKPEKVAAGETYGTVAPGGGFTPQYTAPSKEPTNEFEAFSRGYLDKKQAAIDYNKMQTDEAIRKANETQSFGGSPVQYVDPTTQKPHIGVLTRNNKTGKWDYQESPLQAAAKTGEGLNSSQRAGMKYFDPVGVEENAVSLMRDATSQPSGPGDVILAINHLKTALLGGKNFRVNQAMLDQAEQARAVPASLVAGLQRLGLTDIAKAFDPYSNVSADKYPPGGVLTPAQRQQMLDISVKAMNNLRQVARSQAKPWGVTPDLEPEPLENIKDLYSPGVLQKGKTPQATAQPKVGDVKTFPNGNKARWDGTGWEQVK